MNYLAHAYLSFDDHEILVGNMISDFVKGKKKFDYPPAVLHGIMLHREIDTFTDTHAATKYAASFFKPFVGAYAGAFTDVVYDHFLAKDTKEFPGSGLAIFASRTYSTLSAYDQLLPDQFIKMLPLMIKHNWLLNYSTDKGIENSFGSIFRRALYIKHTDKAYACFKEQYNVLQNCYSQFFPEVKSFAASLYQQMKQPPL